MVTPETKPIRVVLDTNVLISAILFHGSLSLFVTWWQKKLIIPLLSREGFEEFRNVLQYPKFQLSIEEVGYIIEELILPYFEIVDIDGKVPPICRDPLDDIFLFTAEQGDASYLISGDQDLLVMKAYKNVKILAAKEFSTIMASIEL